MELDGIPGALASMPQCLYEIMIAPACIPAPGHELGTSRKEPRMGWLVGTAVRWPRARGCGSQWYPQVQHQQPGLAVLSPASPMGLALGMQGGGGGVAHV